MSPNNKKLSASCKIQIKLGLLRAPVKMSASYFKDYTSFPAQTEYSYFSADTLYA